MLALDRFYMGYLILGIIKAVTFGGFGGWAVYDAIAVSHCWLKDAEGNTMVGCPESAAQSLTEAVEGAEEDIKSRPRSRRCRRFLNKVSDLQVGPNSDEDLNC